MAMQNFSPEFKDPEHYIIDITYRIWEERGIGLIHDWYAPNSIVRTPHGVSNTADSVVNGTMATLHEFPDRLLLPEDVIIGEKASGFYSSHRVRSTATHLGDGGFGQATNRPITMLTVADCLCRDNMVVEEWLVRDQASMAAMLGHDVEAFGRQMGCKNPDNYNVGNDAMVGRWRDDNGLTIEGDKNIAQGIIDTYDAIWNGKNLNGMSDDYDRAVRFEGPSGSLAYSRERVGSLFFGMLSAIPDGKFEPHHVIVRQDEDKPVRVALRWSYAGTHGGNGRYGSPTEVPLTILGISHFELRYGKIQNEWMLVDDLAMYAQIESQTNHHPF